MGKGRTIAGIIYENYLKGRKKSIWVSVSNDLKYDAERDLKDIGAGHIQVHFLSKMKYGKINSDLNGNVKKGVLFATYSALIGESSSGQGKYKSRLKQILNWCGDDFDGVVSIALLLLCAHVCTCVCICIHYFPFWQTCKRPLFSWIYVRKISISEFPRLGNKNYYY